jgi:short-subunit dehydrogenase
MDKTIVVAGANGNLGKRICTSLNEKGAKVKALVRKESDSKTISALETIGIEVYPIDYSDIQSLAGVCIDAHCVVSALSGLHNVIYKTQSQ